MTKTAYPTSWKCGHCSFKIAFGSLMALFSLWGPKKIGIFASHKKVSCNIFLSSLYRLRNLRTQMKSQLKQSMILNDLASHFEIVQDADFPGNSLRGYKEHTFLK